MTWDETTRPTAPTPDPDRPLTARQRASGRHLVDIHDHLRSELEQVRGLVDQVLDGSVQSAAARGRINEMTMRQNSWTLAIAPRTAGW